MPFYLQSIYTSTQHMESPAQCRHQHRLPVESIFRTAGYMLNSKRSPTAPYKVGMVLFIHDNYDVVC